MRSGSKKTNLSYFVLFPSFGRGDNLREGIEQIEPLSFAYLSDPQDPVCYLHQEHRTLPSVEPRVKEQNPQGSLRAQGLWRRHTLDHLVQQVGNSNAQLGRDGGHVIGVDVKHGEKLLLHTIGISPWQVDLIDHRQDREVIGKGKEEVGNCLSLKRNVDTDSNLIPYT